MPAPRPTISSTDQSLRIACLIYRGNPHCGGQGVYSRHLTRELTELGHDVDGVRRAALARARRPGRARARSRASTSTARRTRSGCRGRASSATRVDLQEFAIMCTAGFPEPYTFSLPGPRSCCATAAHDFDLVHDNQCLGTRPARHDRARRLAVRRTRCTTRSPSTATSTWPHTTSPWRKLTLRRWYGFLEHADAGRAPASRATSPCRRTRKQDIVAQMGVARRPAAHRAGRRRPGAASVRCPHVARVPGRLMTTASADVPLKGLTSLIEALAKVRTERDDAHLVVIGQPRDKSRDPRAARAARPAATRSSS